MATLNFELITELQTLTRRDFPVADTAILNPLNAVPLVEGEWLQLNSSYALERGSGIQTNAAVFPVHTERGRYDTQAIGKVNVIMLGMYEAETLLHETTMSGWVVGDQLQINTVAVSGVNRRTIEKDDGGTDNRVLVGFISKITGTGAAAKVRFVHFGNTKSTPV
jgi:hypothetical protein